MQRFRHAITMGDQNRCLYHFTDWRNLTSIRQHGLLSLERLRAAGLVPPAPGGNQLSHDLDEHLGLHRYVHLCLLDQHPMEFVARQEGRIGDTAFLKIMPAILNTPGIRFSNDVSNKNGVRTHPLAEIDGYIDWQVVYYWMDWNDPEVRDRRQAMKKFEILVPDHVPVDLLRMPAGG